MTKPPIAQVLHRIARLPLHHKIAHLRALIELEPLRSIRREELIAALKPLVTRQVKKEGRLSA
jgi:hypothetical protein